MIHLDGSAIDHLLIGKWIPKRDFAMSAIAYGEAIRGALLSPDNGHLILKADFARGLPAEAIVPFDRDIAEVFAELSPRRTGGQQARDLMIAATAMAKGAPLATNDRRLAVLQGVAVQSYSPLEIIHVE